jgi:hypothetical protein
LTTTTRRYAVVAPVMCVSIAFFFRHAWLGGFTLMYGDSYDGLIEISILQHWYNVAAHAATWNITDYFYPHGDTLGYNDTYVVPGVFFALARAVGADPFIAAFVSHVAMRAIGFLGMYALLRRGLAIRWPLAVGGAAIFTTANVSLLHIYHAQLLSVGLIPWLTLFAIGTFEALHRGDGAALRRNGVAFALLFGAITLNAFYGAWFFALFLACFAVIAWFLAPREQRGALTANIRRHVGSLGLIAAVGIVALTPFLLVYLPKLAEGARHSWRSGAYLYLPDLSTLFNVGEGNLVWGPVLRSLAPPGVGLPGGEDRMGYPLGLLIALVLAVSWAAKDRRTRWLTLALALTLALILAAMLRWPGDVSAWFYVYQIMPGADAVRVVDRFLLFALVPLLMIVMTFLDRHPRAPWVTASILGLLLVDEVQTRPPLSLDRADQRAMIAAVGPPPSACHSFFVIAARTGHGQAEARRITRAWGGGQTSGEELMNMYRHNVDAMLIAGYYHVPTINGFSSFNPPDWAFADPRAANYSARVERYAARHKLRHLCGLDRRRQPIWFPVSATFAPPRS